jgi:hypothetical protein
MSKKKKKKNAAQSLRATMNGYSRADKNQQVFKEN